LKVRAAGAKFFLRDTGHQEANSFMFEKEASGIFKKKP
jgi:hypothetical protein